MSKEQRKAKPTEEEQRLQEAREAENQIFQGLSKAIGGYAKLQKLGFSQPEGVRKNVIAYARAAKQNEFIYTKALTQEQAERQDNGHTTES